MMRLLSKVAFALAGMSALVTHASPASTVQTRADEAFEFRVCKLLDSPFEGAVTFGDADGCEWGMSSPDGTTIEGEKIRSTATPVLRKEELKTSFDIQLKAFQEAAQSGVFTLQPLGVCEGGWQVSSTIRPEHPRHMGFFRCNQRLISVVTEGAKSVRQFDYLAGKMVELVK